MWKPNREPMKKKRYAFKILILGLFLLVLTLSLSIAIPHALDKVSETSGLTWLYRVLTPNDLLPIIGVISGLCVTCWTYLRTKDDERVERETLLESLVPLVEITDEIEIDDMSWRFKVRNLGSQPLKTVTLSGVPISQKLEEGSECSFRYLSNGSVLIESSSQTTIPSHRLDFIVEPKNAKEQWDVKRLDFTIQCYDIKERHWVLSFAYTGEKIVETKRPYQV